MFLDAPEYSPEGFFNSDFDVTKMDDITVPGNWQLQGYGKMHYSDLWYNFPINPPYVPTENPTGIYKRTFFVEESYRDKKIIIRFCGVDSAYHLWINGKEVGYSKVARNESEFDITDLIRVGEENDVTVRVYQWSDGTYLEDQDMWWESGIFRDVELIGVPKDGINDYKVIADLDDEYKNGMGRRALASYLEYGYIPLEDGVPDAFHTKEQVSRTLEYAYNDWTIYELGKKLGKPASEIDIFKQRANNYKNVYDPKYKLMVGRSDKGEFNPSFKGTDWSRDFCEGNSWHWSFCVFHDPQGLIDLMGGKKEFNHMMDSVFKMPSRLGMDSRGMIHEMREMQVMNMGQYAHGNQPIQHMVYLYNYSGEPWKAQYWVREIMHKLYTAEADGYCGDEDNGQTSAWYVFSALGFYTVCPGTDQYVFVTPLFKSVKLHLDNGKQVLIQADKADRENRYIKGMKVNGKTYTRNFLTHEQLLGGAKIQYQMSDTPNKQRGTQDSDRPYSFSLE